VKPEGAAFTLHGLLTRAAAAFPDHLAVSGPGGELTYAELDRLSGRIARGLRALGVRPGDRVAVSASKSPTVVATLYAIMRTGAAYVPIDPLSPPRRAARVLADADCRVLCGDAKRLERMGEAVSGRPTVDLTGAATTAALGLGDLERLDPDPVASGCESDLAYVLYTSGSTGAPKGVMLTHRNALAFVEWTVGRFAVGAEDRLVSHAPFHFDLSVFDLYGAAMAGASLHLLGAGEESLGASMSAAVRDRQLTVWYSVPSALVLLSEAAKAEDVASLRVVLFAGEVFPMKHLRALRHLVPDAILANLYGPTETNVCTYHAVAGGLPEGDSPLPIGAACENQEVFALDDQLEPVAEGEVGELWVRGPTVMKGYWGDPELTSQRLGQNPLHDLYPDPAYRTGDLVRRLPGEQYQFLGRRDHQVKSRGYRIELGEIDAALIGHPAVREVAVIAVPDERIGSRLVAFVASEEAIDGLDLKRHCAQALPRYMIPASIVVESSLPHTSTGKIDRQGLIRRAEASPKP
jgi:amino acid adenylation domain-containing protein